MASAPIMRCRARWIFAVFFPVYAKIQMFEPYLWTYTPVKMCIPLLSVASPTPNWV